MWYLIVSIPDLCNLTYFVHSSPRLPQSNDLSEKTVSIVKRIFKKARDSKKYPYLAILAYRTTPLKSCELSPLELCMSRQLRSKLPCTNERLKPLPLKLNDVRKSCQLIVKGRRNFTTDLQNAYFLCKKVIKCVFIFLTNYGSLLL